MKCNSLILGLIVSACVGRDFAANARNNNLVFRVDAAPKTVKNRSGVRLTVTNLSKQDQLFWLGRNDCTHESWRTSASAVLLEGVSHNYSTACMITCVHHIVLHPGETYRITFPFDLAPKDRKGRKILKFALTQPPLELIQAIGKPQNEMPMPLYKMRVFWSAPVAFNLAQQTR